MYIVLVECKESPLCHWTIHILPKCSVLGGFSNTCERDL